MAQPRKPHARTTAQRGYDSEHQRTRAQLLPHALGTWCPLRLPGCDGLMLNPKRMDLDHTVPLALGGRRGPRRLVCSHCNRSAGATLGNRLRGRTRTVPARGVVRSRRW